MNRSFADDVLTTDLVAQYLTGVGEFELLTAEDEIELAQAMETGIEAEVRLAQGVSRSEKVALERSVRKGQQARDRFLTANLRLVVSNARRYQGASGMDFLDLVQEGNLGLIRAVEKFDWRKGFKFSTYATWWIRQAITRGIAQQSRTVRIPVHLHDVIGTVRNTHSHLRSSLGRDPSPEEVAEEAGLDISLVKDALEVTTTISIAQPVGEDGAELGDFIVDDDADDPARMAETNALASEIQEAVQTLSERDAQIVALRYGLVDGRPRPLKEIAEVVGLTPERVRQIERLALAQLRERTQRLQIAG